MDKKLINIKLDKKSFSVGSLSDPPTDKGYWLLKSPAQRLQHVEILRRINYGHSAASRLQRVLEFIEE